MLLCCSCLCGILWRLSPECYHNNLNTLCFHAMADNKSLLFTLCCHVALSFLFSNHGSHPQTDPHMKSKWNSETVTTEAPKHAAILCRPLDCSSQNCSGAQRIFLPELWMHESLILSTVEKRHPSCWQHCSSNSSYICCYSLCHFLFFIHMQMLESNS